MALETNHKISGNLINLLDEKPIEVIVGLGEARKRYWIHPSPICQASLFFNIMIRHEEIVKLYDENPNPFYLFVVYSYFEWCECREATYKQWMKSYWPQPGPPWTMFISGWILGHRIQADGFQEEMLRCLCHYMQDKDEPLISLTPSIISHVYSNTTSEKPALRRFILNIMVKYGHEFVDRSTTREEWAAIAREHEDLSGDLILAMREATDYWTFVGRLCEDI
ncbi:MAG: hypothetical protein M1834_008286 [Cirrosporium novae-zelandiae]|nr:MAG: hypothetical protein M1834_008286 [Cirrosporium novae-zelandiae]